MAELPDVDSLFEDDEPDSPSHMADEDVMVEAAMRAAYDAQPQWTGKRGTPEYRPKTYEECYGCSPLEHTEDAEEMRIALRAALASRPSPTAEALYRVEVEGGGSFLYDLIDVGRFAQRMAQEGDTRPFFVALDAYRAEAPDA